MSDIANENVVKLDDYDQMRRGLGNGPGTHALREVRDLAADRLKQHLERMLGKVDDVLFARAEIAESQMVRAGYMNAMRELGRMRAALEDEFLAAFHIRFNQGVRRGNQHELAAGTGSADRSVEEEQAIADMIAGARSLCTRSLYALDRRLGFLIRDPELEQWENPLGPEVVCDAFRQAAALLQTDPGIRLVIFKLFDEHVICHLNELYLEANRLLINLGVLPEDLSNAHRRNRRKRTTDTPGTAPATLEPQYPAVEDPVSGSTDRIAPTLRAELPTYGNAAESPTGDDAAISALTLLQRGGSATANEHGACFSLDPAALNSGKVNVLRGLKALPAIRRLGQTGDTAIDMVAMLFDYILDDPNVPDAMRARIGRLQIPVLKVALLDREFFARKSHPVRQLLNLLAKTSAGRNTPAPGADPFYLKSDSVVQTIVDRFETDTGLFQVLLDDLNDFLCGEYTRARAHGERSARIQEGQERLQAARVEVLEEIEPRIGNGDNLDFVREFVASHWKNLLFITCARHGKNSETWQRALATMDTLIWSVRPKTTLEERKRLLAIQPTLLADLRVGMEQLTIPVAERDRFIARLVHAHGRAGLEQPATGDTTAQRTSTRQTDSDKPVRAPHAAPASRQQATANRLPPRPAVAEDPHHACARALKSGDWLQIAGPDEKPLRAKLSWISPITGTYLFTDHLGAKIGNYTLDELAELLREGQATVINGTPLMERAVDKVLTEYPPA